jgi:CRISPR/Cas system Type II protein with McrA/HNH and RuvC-like nuclease domain
MDKVLVLNADYTPLNVTSLRRGFILVIKGKAEILEKGVEPIITTIGDFVRPVIIRLLNYVRYHTKPLKINRKRLYKRDDNQCVYCGSKKHLTIDHVLPKSRGGDNSWKNLVTCCLSCNLKKGNKTPEEAGMKMISKPYEPSIFSNIVNPQVDIIWGNFKKSFV